MKLTEYTENGTRFYALEAQDWTQYKKEQHHYVAFQAPAVERKTLQPIRPSPGAYRLSTASLLNKGENQAWNFWTT